MRLQVVDCCRDGLGGRTLVERGFGLLSVFPSVAVHVVGSEMVVIDADGLPVAFLEDEQNDRVALNRSPGLAEADEGTLNNVDIYCPLIGHGWQRHMPSGRRGQIGFADDRYPPPWQKRRKVCGATMGIMLERRHDEKMDALDARVDRVVLSLRELRMEMRAGFDRIHRLMIVDGVLLVALVAVLAAHP